MTIQILPLERSTLDASSRVRWSLKALVAAGLIAAAGAAFWLSSRGGLSAAVPLTTSSSGSLEVGTTPFPFTPETCSILGDSFITAGPGTNGFGDYWVSASESKIEILFNVSSEVDTPPDGFPWLESGDVGWSSPSSNQVVAVSKMTATRGLLTSGRGTLELDCR